MAIGIVLLACDQPRSPEGLPLLAGMEPAYRGTGEWGVSRTIYSFRGDFKQVAVAAGRQLARGFHPTEPCEGCTTTKQAAVWSNGQVFVTVSSGKWEAGKVSECEGWVSVTISR